MYNDKQDQDKKAAFYIGLSKAIKAPQTKKTSAYIGVFAVTFGMALSRFLRGSEPNYYAYVLFFLSFFMFSIFIFGLVTRSSWMNKLTGVFFVLFSVSLLIFGVQKAGESGIYTGLQNYEDYFVPVGILTMCISLIFLCLSALVYGDQSRRKFSLFALLYMILCTIGVSYLLFTHR